MIPACRAGLRSLSAGRSTTPSNSSRVTLRSSSAAEGRYPVRAASAMTTSLLVVWFNRLDEAARVATRAPAESARRTCTVKSPVRVLGHGPAVSAATSCRGGQSGTERPGARSHSSRFRSINDATRSVAAAQKPNVDSLMAKTDVLVLLTRVSGSHEPASKHVSGTQPHRAVVKPDSARYPNRACPRCMGWALGTRGAPRTEIRPTFFRRRQNRPRFAFLHVAWRQAPASRCPIKAGHAYSVVSRRRSRLSPLSVAIGWSA